MPFDPETREMVRKAIAEKRHDLLYVMMPADDGGQSYEMKCQICGERGNILASKFDHARDCPVELEEQESLKRSREDSTGTGEA